MGEAKESEAGRKSRQNEAVLKDYEQTRADLRETQKERAHSLRMGGLLVAGVIVAGLSQGNQAGRVLVELGIFGLMVVLLYQAFITRSILTTLQRLKDIESELRGRKAGGHGDSARMHAQIRLPQADLLALGLITIVAGAVGVSRYANPAWGQVKSLVGGLLVIWLALGAVVAVRTKRGFEKLLSSESQ